MKWLLVLAVAFAVGTTGCAKKKRDSSAESADSAAQADTAELDSTADPEPLPSLDDDTAAAPTTSSNDTPAPAPEAATPPPVEGTGDMAMYTVQAGDTLMKIAFNVYGDIRQWKTLYENNQGVLKNANKLEAGLQLKYDKPKAEPLVERNGDPYMIKKGDTLGTIADDIYAKKSKWKKLYENNRSLIKDPNRIYAGFYLYYQITEAEKQEAEAIKAKRGGLGMGGAAPSPTGVVQAAADEAAAAPAKAGGLDSLAAPPAGRAPASH